MIGRGDVSNRLDAFYWQPQFHAIDAIFDRHSKWSFRLGEIAYGLTNGDHGGVRYTETGIRYLRGQSVTEFGLSLDKDTKFISNEDHTRMVRAEVIPGDVLYTIAGSIGNACVVTDIEKANINQAIVKIRPSEQISAQYLADFLNSSLGKLQSRRIANGGVQLNINFSEVKAQRILVPPLDIQQGLVAKLNAAKQAYKAALASAESLLCSVDDYLMFELGITLPPEPENTIASRIFFVQRRELAGFRFDARVHRADFDLVSTRFDSPPLKQIAEINPRTTFRNIEDETRLTFVPMEAITDEDGTINAPQERIFAESGGYTSFQEGDLLWAKITPCMENGKSAVAESLLNGYGFGSTEYHVFRSKSVDLNIKFLHAILRMKKLRQAATNYFGGSSGHQRVDEAFFARLHIPLPDATTQRHIVEEIENRRADARNLRAAAAADFETAKRRIEFMLLGEAQ